MNRQGKKENKMTKKVEIKFNTIGGQKILTWTVEQALDSELKNAMKWILKNQNSGIIGGTFDNIPNMGKVKINLI